jgi:hypothetical protein
MNRTMKMTGRKQRLAGEYGCAMRRRIEKDVKSPSRRSYPGIIRLLDGVVVHPFGKLRLAAIARTKVALMGRSQGLGHGIRLGEQKQEKQACWGGDERAKVCSCIRPENSASMRRAARDHDTLPPAKPAPHLAAMPPRLLLVA